MRRNAGIAGFTLVEVLVVVAVIAVLAAILFPVFSGAREKARATACLSHVKHLGLAVETYLGDWDDAYPMNRFPVRPGDTIWRGWNQGSTYTWRRALDPYTCDLSLWICPSNDYLWSTRGHEAEIGAVPGDPSNKDPAFGERPIPASYAYNGSYFGESMPGGEYEQRPRERSEIREADRLILLLESRTGNPDLGWWCMNRDCADAGDGVGPFQTHRGRVNFIFADTHAESLKLVQTLSPRPRWLEFSDAEQESMFREIIGEAYARAVAQWPEYR